MHRRTIQASILALLFLAFASIPAAARWTPNPERGSASSTLSAGRR